MGGRIVIRSVTREDSDDLGALYERAGFVFEDGAADGKQLIGRLPLRGGGRS